MHPRTLALAALAAGSFISCRGGDDHAHGGAPEGWAVTAWGERYEVFAETGPLVAGASATSNAHVTVLAGFAPLKQGKVTLILRGAGSEQAFAQEKPKRDGIFPVELKPRAEGTFDLLFRVESAAGREDVAAGRVRVGSAASPGGLTGETSAEPSGAISFLKEQQWRTEFATAWTAESALPESVGGPAQVKPTGGGEVVLTAAADATVAASPWPHVGLAVGRGATVFGLLPRAGDRSLLELRADVSALEAEAGVARRRVARLTELLAREATSQAELDRARAALAAVEARLAAARGGIAATGQATGASAGATLAVRAPWAGSVAEVSVSPGQTVAAGTALGRLVKVRPIWVQVALRPEDAARVPDRIAGLAVRRPGRPEALEVPGADVKVVSRAPEVDPRTASVTLILQVDRSASELPLGSAVEADLVLPGERRGVVVPLTALVDDAGTTVTYVQLDGESFARKEVRVLGRLGNRALVEGLEERDRLVTRGAAAVRRSSLLSAGAPEGHVH